MSTPSDTPRSLPSKETKDLMAALQKSLGRACPVCEGTPDAQECNWVTSGEPCEAYDA